MSRSIRPNEGGATAAGAESEAPASPLSDLDRYLFHEGTLRRMAGRFGAVLADDGEGAHLAVWAPNARTVSVVGEWNGWQHGADPLESDGSGVWSAWVPAARRGQVYKFSLELPDGSRVEKADPVAVRSEVPPRTGSVLWDLDYRWGDSTWMEERGRVDAQSLPISVYEVHLGSWLRSGEDPRRLLGYRELAPLLVEHVRSLGFTHVEFLPVMEHPYYGSWGYQTTGFFAPTARYGSPQDLMALIDTLHQAGIGVLLDWVPAHFPGDSFALAQFDGSHLYDHADPRRGVHPDWGSLVFNYGRHEVRSFLASSADHWLRTFHADGLRVDAVASMLYLDYSRSPGDWVPNASGGREDLDAVYFLRQLTDGILEDHPGVQVVAEESTAWPGVTAPVESGGLGFTGKWDMGWMHDTLGYLAEDPIHRRYHHGELTFRGVYAWSERFVLPLSHDEVVHGKGSLLAKMPGDDWQRFATLRLLFGYQYATPGKKLLFMGAELGTTAEWDHERGLDWDLVDQAPNAGVWRWLADCNRLLRAEPALYERDDRADGFEWVLRDDDTSSLLAFVRRGDHGRPLLVACNFTPVPRHNVLLGVPEHGFWRELVNSDAELYGGSGQGNLGGVASQPVPWHGWPCAVTLTLPPLACVVLGREDG